MTEDEQHEREMNMNAHIAWAFALLGSAEVANERGNSLSAAINTCFFEICVRQSIIWAWKRRHRSSALAASWLPCGRACLEERRHSAAPSGSGGRGAMPCSLAVSPRDTLIEWITVRRRGSSTRPCGTASALETDQCELEVILIDGDPPKFYLRLRIGVVDIRVRAGTSPPVQEFQAFDQKRCGFRKRSQPPELPRQLALRGRRSRPGWPRRILDPHAPSR